MEDLELLSRDEEFLTIEEYIDLIKKHGLNIPNVESIEIVPPNITKQKDWGGFLVKYKSPVFKFCHS